MLCSLSWFFRHGDPRADLAGVGSTEDGCRDSVLVAWLFRLGIIPMTNKKSQGPKGPKFRQKAATQIIIASIMHNIVRKDADDILLVDIIDISFVSYCRHDTCV